jgi:hypothetical protein
MKMHTAIRKSAFGKVGKPLIADSTVPVQCESGAVYSRTFLIKRAFSVKLFMAS